MAVRDSAPVVINTPLIVWHGGIGGNDPIYSCDFLQTHERSGVLATSGTDATVRLWRLQAPEYAPEFVFELEDHQKAVNAIRFSSNGLHLATASERSVVIYTIQNGPKGWFDTSNTREVAKRVVHTHLEEIYDLAWSPCNAYIMVCSIDHKSEIVKVNGETESIPLHKHDNYVQGVAFDPRGDFVCTNGLDRVCRVQALKWTKKKLKLDPRRTHVMKYHAEEPSASGVSAAASGAADDSEDVKDTEAAVAETSATAPQQQPPKHRDHLFLGTSVSAFFRRPCFTPDGEFLLVPAGLSVAQQGVEPELCTQMAHRSDFSKPYACIAGIDTPSLAIRACPSLFSMIDHKQADVQTLTEGRHRSIFAVLTTDTVYIHDTQHPNPLMKISNIHHANLNDCAWAPDGSMLFVCSSDGYVTIVRFRDGVLGERLPDSEVPVYTRAAFPLVYTQPPTAEKDNQSPVSVAQSAGVEADQPSTAAEQALQTEPCQAAQSEPEGVAGKPQLTVPSTPVQTAFLPDAVVTPNRTTPSSTPSSSSSSSSSSSQKKKRITPSFVGPLQQPSPLLKLRREPSAVIGAGTPLFQSVIASSPRIAAPSPVSATKAPSAATEAGAASNGAATDGTRKKRRITPTLVSSST